jgi:hypothetical protein
MTAKEAATAKDHRRHVACRHESTCCREFHRLHNGFIRSVP